MLKFPKYPLEEEAGDGTAGGGGGAQPQQDNQPGGQGQDGADGGAAPAGELQDPGDRADAPAAQEGAGGEPTDAGAKKGGGLDKRFSELTARAKEAERRATESEKRLGQALEAVERLTGKSADDGKKAANVEDPKPTPPTFTDPEQFTRDMTAYAEALADWTSRRAVKTGLAEAEQKRIEDGKKEQAQQTHTAFVKRRTEALSKYPDYVEVAEAPDLPISEPMARAIHGDPMGTDVVYYLGQNRAEAERIHALPPGQQLVEFGMLKAKLLASQASGKVTNAKPPIKPVGGSTTTTKPLGELPMDEYAARRNAEIAAARRAPGTR